MSDDIKDMIAGEISQQIFEATNASKEPESRDSTVTAHETSMPNLNSLVEAANKCLGLTGEKVAEELQEKFDEDIDKFVSESKDDLNEQLKKVLKSIR